LRGVIGRLRAPVAACAGNARFSITSSKPADARISLMPWTAGKKRMAMSGRNTLWKRQKLSFRLMMHPASMSRRRALRTAIFH